MRLNTIAGKRMANSIGLIQTRGIGDIIIALPIADYYLEQGLRVYWPIEARFVPMFSRVKPQVNFIPVEPGADAMVERPQRLLKEAGVAKTVMLYSSLSGGYVVEKPRLAASLKFDEYKYAVANVPFARKWDLRIRRDASREAALHESLKITRPYVCTHTTGSDFSLKLNVPSDWSEKYQIVEMRELTDSPFDWLYTLEHASKLLLLDSCFSNLVEQLNLPVEKYFLLRSPINFTPVLRNEWTYVALNQGCA